MIDRYAREHGEYFTPKTVLDIFTEFSKASSAILVPFTTKAQFISEIASVSEIDVLKSGILGEHLLDPIAKAGAHAVTAAKKSHYDLVILDPPFGIMAPEKQFGTRDRALIEFASSLSSLSENGLALGVFSQGILWRHTDKAWYQAIEDDGFHVNAVIELPSGTYSPYTNIGTVMLAVSRVRSNGYLSIESSASSPETIRSLLETLLTKPNSVHKLLRFPEAPYKYDLPSSLRSRNIVDTRLQKFGYPVINLLDACRDIRLTREQYGFLDEEGALFVPNIGTGNVVTSIADMTMKNHHNYFQLILNEAMIMPDYAAQMLNSDVGKLQRETLFTGAVIPKVSASSFKTIGLRIPVPPIDEQRKLIQLNNNIRASMNTLGALQDDVWRSPREYREHKQSYEDLVETNPQAWVEDIAHPISVIIKAYYTEQDVSNRLKYLLNFFEALSELIAAIYLGALVRNGQLYKDFEITVADSLDMNRALGSPSFGGWQTLISVAAKYLRNIVCKTGEQEFPNRLTLTEAFSLVDYELINLLCDKSLVSSTKAALDVRNSQSHGGIISIDPVIQQNLITELDSQLVLIEPVLRRIFKRFRMVTVDRPILSGDIDKHSYTVNLINGSSAIFNKDNVSLDRGLLPDRVYMHEDDSSLALPLFPLIRFSTGPTTANNTLYFYNKTTGLETVWKAYQFTDEPTITLAFDISAELPSDS